MAVRRMRLGRWTEEVLDAATEVLHERIDEHRREQGPTFTVTPLWRSRVRRPLSPASAARVPGSPWTLPWNFPALEPARYRRPTDH